MLSVCLSVCLSVFMCIQLAYTTQIKPQSQVHTHYQADMITQAWQPAHKLYQSDLLVLMPPHALIPVHPVILAAQSLCMISSHTIYPPAINIHQYSCVYAHAILFSQWNAVCREMVREPVKINLTSCSTQWIREFSHVNIAPP